MSSVRGGMIEALHYAELQLLAARIWKPLPSQETAGGRKAQLSVPLICHSLWSEILEVSK